MLTTVLFPSSYEGVKQIDEDFVQEYDAICENPQLHPILFGYDAWFNENKLRLSEKPEADSSKKDDSGCCYFYNPCVHFIQLSQFGTHCVPN